MVQGREDVVGLDSAVILAPQVWQASGHLDTFTDPLTECLSCHKRFREDQLVEAYEHKHGKAPEGGLAGINCPNCGNKGQFTEPRDFTACCARRSDRCRTRALFTICAPKLHRESS
jgi:glycyl-tRNA synthetase